MELHDFFKNVKNVSYFYLKQIFSTGKKILLCTLHILHPKIPRYILKKIMVYLRRFTFARIDISYMDPSNDVFHTFLPYH